MEEKRNSTIQQEARTDFLLSSSFFTHAIQLFINNL